MACKTFRSKTQTVTEGTDRSLCRRLSYSRFKMLRLSSSSTAGRWLSLLRKNTRITFWTISTPSLPGLLPPPAPPASGLRAFSPH